MSMENEMNSEGWETCMCLWAWEGMKEHKWKCMNALIIIQVRRVLLVIQASWQVVLQEAICGWVTCVTKPELALIAPPACRGWSTLLIAHPASSSAGFDGVVGDFHPLGSAGSVGLGSTTVLAGVVTTDELMSKLNSKLFHGLLSPCRWWQSIQDEAVHYCNIEDEPEDVLVALSWFGPHWIVPAKLIILVHSAHKKIVNLDR